MPAKGKSKVSDRQRQVIAAAKVAGKTNKQIAATVDLHPKTVAAASRDVRTTTLIGRLKEKHETALDKIFADTIIRLASDVKSKDFAIRHQSRNFALKAITAGDPPLHRVGDAGGSSDGDFTLEELLITMRTVTKRAS